MKKILLVVCVLFSVSVRAQIKEGSVKYSMKMDGNPSDIAAQMMSNSTVTIYFKNDKALMEMATPAYSMRTLTDANGVLMLMDAAGQKFYSRKSKAEADMAAKNVSGITATATNESKKILGYDCKKVLLSIPDGRGGMNKMTAWKTDKIRNSPGIGPVNAEVLAKLNGMALEIEMEQAGIKSRMTATEISTKPLNDAVFNVSTNGYAERKLPAGKR